AGRVLLADRERREAERVAADRPREQEVAVALVVDDRLRARVVIRGVADVIAEKMRVEVLEEPRVAVPPRRVLDGDLLEVDVPVEVDRVAAAELDLEPGVTQVRVADERLVLVVDPSLPAVLGDPRELPVEPDAEAARVTGRVVLEADVREIDVPHRVRRV